MLIRKKYTITGRVQNVGLRRRAARIAKEVNLTGWVKNCADGNRVEMELQGEEADIEYLLGRLEAHAWFDEVQTQRMGLADEYDFKIIR